MMEKMKDKRIYHTYNPDDGYPAGENLYYECGKCDDVLPSLPEDSVFCSCGNIAIDVDYGRVSIKNHDAVKIFSKTSED